MAASHSGEPKEIHFQRGSCKIIVKPGDLLSETDVKALVIPAPHPNELKAENFALFRTVSRLADRFGQKQQIEKLHSDLSPQKAEAFLSSTPKYIFVVPPYLGNEKKAIELLKKTYSSCLEVAAEKNLASIAFPTIGGGVIGFRADAAASCACSALENFLTSKSNKDKIAEIRLVVYDAKIYKDFTNYFIDYASKNKIEYKHVPISTKKLNPPEMSRVNDRHATSDQRTENFGTLGNPNSSSDSHTRDTVHNDSTSASSTLNPKAEPYQPKSDTQCNGVRKFYLTNRAKTLVIIQGDILKAEVDAIVNVVDETMLHGDKIDKEIRDVAGPKLQTACQAYKEIKKGVRLPIGRSRILLSYNLSKKIYYIINTAAPVYNGNSPDECQKKLSSCYKTSLDLAHLYDLKTIAFPAISCGEHDYPCDEAAEVALTAINKHDGFIKEILFIVPNDKLYAAWVKKAKELQFQSQDYMPSNAECTTTDSSTLHLNPTTTSTSKVIDMDKIDHADEENLQGQSLQNNDRKPETPGDNPSNNFTPGTADTSQLTKKPNEKNSTKEPEKKKTTQSNQIPFSKGGVGRGQPNPNRK